MNWAVFLYVLSIAGLLIGVIGALILMVMVCVMAHERFGELGGWVAVFAIVTLAVATTAGLIA